jgi:hypothetical protein
MQRCAGPFRHAARRRQRLPPPGPAAPFDFFGLALILKVRVRVPVGPVLGALCQDCRNSGGRTPCPKALAPQTHADAAAGRHTFGFQHPSQLHLSSRTTSRLLVPRRPVQSWVLFPLIPTLTASCGNPDIPPSSPLFVLAPTFWAISIALHSPAPAPAVATAPRLVCFIRDSRTPLSIFIPH